MVLSNYFFILVKPNSGNPVNQDISGIKPSANTPNNPNNLGRQDVMPPPRVPGFQFKGTKLDKKSFPNGNEFFNFFPDVQTS